MKTIRNAALTLCLFTLGSCCCEAVSTSYGYSRQAEADRMTIDWVVWSDDRDMLGALANAYDDERPLLLGHVIEWKDFEVLKQFTRDADKEFVLEAPGRPAVVVAAGTGGTTTSDGGTRYVHLHVREVDALVPGTRYSLRPLNREASHEWVVADELIVTRDR